MPKIRQLNIKLIQTRLNKSTKKKAPITRVVVGGFILGSLAIMSGYHQNSIDKSNTYIKDDVPIFIRCKYHGEPTVLSRFEELFYSEDKFKFSRYLIDKQYVDDRFKLLKPETKSYLDIDRKKIEILNNIHADPIFIASNNLHELLGPNDIDELSEETLKKGLALWNSNENLRCINPSRFELERTLIDFIEINKYQRQKYKGCKGI